MGCNTSLYSKTIALVAKKSFFPPCEKVKYPSKLGPSAPDKNRLIYPYGGQIQAISPYSKAILREFDGM